MNRQGGQPLRFTGYVQQPLQNRETRPPNNIGPGRVQNASKLGNGTGTGWGFGTPTNGMSGLGGTQSRQTGPGPTSFAQTIGANHSSAPLDMSEFPSLSGNAQPQFPNNNNPIWQRPTQQTPVQRPPQQSSVNNTQQHPPSNPQHPTSPSNEDMFMGSSHLQGSMDDYRQSNHQMASRQPPSQTIDDFPPLGRNGTDEHSNEQARFGFPSQSTFLQDSAARSNIPSAFANPTDSTRSSSVVDRTMSPGSARPAQTPTNNLSSLLSSFNNTRASSANQQQNAMQDFDNRIPGKKEEEMSEADRWGLGGFLAKIRSNDEMVQNLARGHDLTLLGLNLNSQDPLWPTWNGPFAETNSRPLIPDFNLPECYTVTNVHQVRQKLPNFTEETLFWIFYTQPKDIIQELAASELNNRNWRFLKSLQMWLTKDPSLPEPMRLTEEAEKGSYIFFDYRIWEKRRYQEFELHYRELAPVGGPRVNDSS